jgi:hypothetical protein
MRPYKRIRIRDVWVDYHPGSRLLSVPRRRLGNGNTPVVVLPPAGPGPSDPHVEPPPPKDFDADSPVLCIVGNNIFNQNLLSDLLPSQFPPSLSVGGVFQGARLTNGNGAYGLNLLVNDLSSPGRTATSVDPVLPIVYTLPISRTVNRIQFSYSPSSARTNPVNAIPPEVFEQGVAMGGISVRLFDAANVFLAAVHHYASEFPSVPNVRSEYDTCSGRGVINLLFEADVVNVRKISIWFRSRHFGLNEIEAYPFASIPPNPIDLLLQTVSYQSLVAPPTTVTPARTALFSHTNPLTLVVETGTKFFASSFTRLKDGLINTGPGDGHSGSTPNAPWWITLSSPTDITSIVSTGFQDTAANSAFLDIKPFSIAFYNDIGTIIKTIDLDSSSVNSVPNVVGQYVKLRIAFQSGKLIAGEVKYIRFIFGPSGLTRGLKELEIY